MSTATAAFPRLIVCQRTLDWVVGWKRSLRGTAIPLLQTRTLTHCGEALAARPASFVAVEIAVQNLAAAIDALPDWSRRYPAARFIALLGRESVAWEPLVREAGAIYVAHSPARLEGAVRLVKRHLALAPQPELTLREAVWSRLPWSA